MEETEVYENVVEQDRTGKYDGDNCTEVLAFISIMEKDKTFCRMVDDFNKGIKPKPIEIKPKYRKK